MKNYIFINYKKQLVKISISDIMYIEADGDYCKIFTTEKMYHFHCTLIFLQSKLSKEIFYRCHRSFLVNIDRITIIEKETIYINKTSVPISELYKKDLLKKINLVMFNVLRTES